MYKLSMIKRGIVVSCGAHGFLLLEALLALVLFISGVTIVAYYYSLGARTQRNARVRSAAVAWSASCMERCRAQRCLPKELRSEHAGCVLTWKAQPYVDELVRDEDALLEVTLETRWQSDQGVDHTYILSSLIAMQPGSAERFV